MLKIISAFSMLILAASAVNASQGTIACALLKLRIVPVGTECLTASNVAFQLIDRSTVDGSNTRESWKDESTGITWYDNSNYTSMPSALLMCYMPANKISLPSKDDYTKAVADGFLEVATDGGTQTSAWTSTPTDASGAYYTIFSFADGSFASPTTYVNANARCIGR